MQTSSIQFVIKRDGTKKPFTLEKITASIEAAGKDTGEYDKKIATEITKKVQVKLARTAVKEHTLTVQHIRDIVEPTIAEAGYFATAKYYILYGEKKQQKHKKLAITERDLT